MDAKKIPSLPVGELITYEGRTYRVCPSILNRCRTCAFDTGGTGRCRLSDEARETFGHCGTAHRTDHRKVIFRPN